MTLLADVALRATLLLAAALVGTAMLRRAAAATRHLAWTLAVVCVLALPVLMTALPDWRIIPAWPHGLDALPHVASSVDPAQPFRTAAAAQPATAVRAAEPVPAPLSRLDRAAPAALLAVWALVGAALLVRIVAGIAAVRRLARHARPADARSRRILDEILTATAVNSPIRLLVSADVTTPMTWGGAHPLLLLPPGAREWSDDRVRVVLLHELAHIRRRDWLTHALGRVLVACHWFNPLAWMAVRAMTRERERACDDFVIAMGSPAADYAQHLLDIARHGPPRDGWAIAPAMARQSELEGRLLSILTPRRREAGHFAAPAVALAAIVAAVSVGAAAPSALPQPAAPAALPARAAWPSTAGMEIAAASREERRQQRDALEALAGAIDDPSEDVREKAALALAVQSDPDVLQPLLRALKDPSAQVREKAALGLAFRRQPAAVDALLAAVGDSDPQVREKVIFALSLSGDARAIPPLIAAASDPDEQVREKAVQGLALVSATGGSRGPIDADALRDAVRGGLAGAIAAITR